MVSRLRYAALIDMGADAAAGWSDGDENLFRMPWKAVAIEDSNSCCFLERLGQVDPGWAASELTKALEGTNKWGVRQDTPHVSRNKRSSTKDVGLYHGDYFAFSYVQSVPEEKIVVMYSCVAVFLGMPPGKGLAFHLGPVCRTIEVKGKMRSDILTHETTREEAVEVVNQLTNVTWQCVKITQPGVWLAKDVASEVSAQRMVLSKKIPRAHQRERWLVITDEERRQSHRAPAEAASQDRMAPVAHPRRAHYRRIGTEDDGKPKLTWVRACWVGSPEVEIRGGRYRVETEM
jgi:hypothetical protein